MLTQSVTVTLTAYESAVKFKLEDWESAGAPRGLILIDGEVKLAENAQH